MIIRKPTIAVLLTCHNRKDKTLKSLRNLFEQDGLEIDFKVEVFLVDDASTDGTGEAIKKQFPEVNILQGNGNLYWNRGMHLAWQTAVATNDFDFYLWLNDDTFLFEQGLLNLMAAAFLSNNQSAICGSTISLETNTISYGGNSKTGKLLIPDGKLQEVYAFNGNVVLIPKYIYDKVGILDLRFPHAIGDFEYALRIRSFKLKSYISSDFVGSCEKNKSLPVWCLPSSSFVKRACNLYSPLGNSHPYYFFLFELKYYGLLRAIKHLFSIHLRVLIPQLWISNR